MGGGYWRREDFTRYSAVMGRRVRADGHIDTSGMHGAQDMYRARGLDPQMDPYRVMRECCDNEEHPNTVPVILALDVTGSMGGALLKTASALGVIMQNTLDQFRDVEFMVMGIGDLAYDRAPIQISQFESDIRVAEHLDRIWFERGGGGNAFESYTAAWYMGVHHTSLDCWKRGKKGVIITLGDEPLNPYLPADKLARVTGDHLQGDVKTDRLYDIARKKFDIFHIAIDDPGDCFDRYEQAIRHSFGKILKNRLRISTLDALPNTILQCLQEAGVGNRRGRYADADGEYTGCGRYADTDAGHARRGRRASAADEYIRRGRYADADDEYTRRGRYADADDEYTGRGRYADADDEYTRRGRRASAADEYIRRRRHADTDGEHHRYNDVRKGSYGRSEHGGRGKKHAGYHADDHTHAGYHG